MMSWLQAPWRITFDTNPEQCNLRCIFCEVHSIYNKSRTSVGEPMDPRIVEQVVAETAPLGLKEIIPSTMGEPLLYKHFDVFPRVASQYGVKINLTTNGTFPQHGVEKWAQIILPVASDIKISVNGATKETAERIMMGLDFERQMRNVETLVEMRDALETGSQKPTITFQVVFMESNINELPDILKTGIEMGVDRFKGHHLWVTWPELETESLLRNKNARMRWNAMAQKLHKIASSKKDRTIRIDNVFPVRYDDAPIPSSWTCPFLGREAWIARDGTFNVCCSPEENRRRLGYFGNVSDNGFMSLWRSQEYRTLVSGWGSYDACRLCRMRRPRAA